MKRVMLGALVATLATGAVAATGASASEPAFFECATVMGGKYKGPCKVEGPKGNRELVEGVGNGKAFKGVGSELKHEIPAVGDRGHFCSSSKVTGKLVTPTTEHAIVISFKGCVGDGKNCTTPGQKAGIVVSHPMVGTLGYVNASEHRVGLDLTPELGSELMTWNCEGLLYQVSGSLIGEITPVDVLTKTYTVTYTLDAEEFQGIKSFEGEAEDVPSYLINGSGPFKGSFSGSFTYQGERLELKG
jgi:hypothetical protein